MATVPSRPIRPGDVSLINVACPPWEPHSDMRAAWQIVEAMVAKGWGGFGWDGYDHGCKWLVGFGYNQAEAETMPTAICRAALLALIAT